MAKLLPYSGDYYLWKYVPSIAGAVIFILLFICTTALNGYKTWKNKTWFCIPLVIGCSMEFVGYAARASAAGRTDSLMTFSIQSSWILIAPTLFAASIYMCFGRLVRHLHAESYSIIPAKWLTKTFVLGDVLSFLIQGGAAGMLIIQNLATVGKAMVILGLVIQVLSFGLFMVTAVIFHRRLVANMTKRVERDVDWLGVMRMLYAVSGLIMIRSIFRLVEYGEGMDGYLMSHEWTAYLFDAVPMIAVTGIYFFKFPAQLRVGVETAGEYDGEGLTVISVPGK
ncbi:RTA1-domain-containing protein [Aureobasidium pullulans]|uniref:RTA1-domain-containing protein n=1 Tax=Aureobasidium pullulans TaxID=5580 RepID=A0AB74IYM1_AURPU|nr:RTA1-domain-containing protein [Aureobasidium pullulans]